jgi:beta-galactosidase GanA
MPDITMGSTTQFPCLVDSGNGKQLTVHGKPFLMLPGELQNSSLSSAEYMDTVWQKLVDSNFNTILGCVTWEDIEPVEGEYHFQQLDKVIAGARAHNLHLVLLWFGSFKNGTTLPDTDV